jgi:hypothetical protein
MACTGWHGVHGEARSATDRLVYALALDCGAGRGFDHVGYLEAAASHELLEAATDPFVDSAPAYATAPTAPGPWSIFGELTDRCVGQYLQRTGYVLARNWSNAAARAGDDPCVPVPAGDVFYGVWTPATTVHAAPGATITLQLTGFARGPVADFGVRAYAAAGFDTAPTLSRATLNAGVSATLRLTIPAGVSSGSAAWVVLLVGPDDGDSRNDPIMVLVD